MLKELIVVCVVTWWPGSTIAQEHLIVRSAAQCSQIGLSRRYGVAMVGATGEHDSAGMIAVCGPKLVDCKDWR